jgi:hypothetical protein
LNDSATAATATNDEFHHSIQSKDYPNERRMDVFTPVSYFVLLNYTVAYARNKKLEKNEIFVVNCHKIHMRKSEANCLEMGKKTILLLT